MEHLENQKILLRLENQFEADEPVTHNLNTNVTIDVQVSCSLLLGFCITTSQLCLLVQNLFSSFQVKEMAELSLGGNALLSSINRLHWDIVPSSE